MSSPAPDTGSIEQITMDKAKVETKNGDHDHSPYGTPQKDRRHDNNQRQEATKPSGDTTSTANIQLCPELLAFYQSHNVLDETSMSNLATADGYRFVRLNPRYKKEETLTLLQEELDAFHQSKETVQQATKSNQSAPPKAQIPRPVDWLAPIWGFYALPGDFSLSSSPCFRSGRVYGMDISSGASVAALLTNDYDRETKVDNNTITKPSLQVKADNEIRVLDLCTCPGLKLLTMADFFYQQHPKRKVKVIGVDVNRNRMEKCKSIVQKYWVDADTSGDVETTKAHDINLQLYVADGTTFGTGLTDIIGDSFVFDSTVAMGEMKERGKRKRLNKSARARQRKRLREIASSETSVRLDDHNDTDDTEQPETTIEKFDYVLVDAECSTDGSFKHVKERIKENQQINVDNDAVEYQEANGRLTDQNKLSELVALQKQLIHSGFRLLKSGGAMLYSTCSLSHDQNERVVQWLLEMHTDAFLIPIHFPKVARNKYIVEGSLGGTVRFYPNFSAELDLENLLLGDGFFAAKIGKKRKL